jgi:imidazolonepropionase-like amidohydrolase
MKTGNQKAVHALAAACMWAIAATASAFDWHAAEPDKPPEDTSVLIKNVSIFNGTSEKLITGKDVVIKGNVIEGLIKSGSDESGYDQVVDGKGGYLTPGLIDVHYHAVLGLEPAAMASAPKSYVVSVATWELSEVLKRGVTTVRDAGGDVAGIKKAIDQGYLTGPRIYPSQAVLGQYSGHTDFRNPNFLPKEWGGPADPFEVTGVGLLANGRDQVIAGTRDNLYKGASQIKIAVSGGVISFTDPLYVHEFMADEIEGAVAAAKDYGTYVMAHAHSADPIKRSIKAGVKSIDHNSRADEEAVKMMAEYDVHISLQPLTAKQIMEAYPEDDVRHIKAKLAFEGTGDVMKWAKKYGVHMAWGTDLLNSIETRKTQLQDLTIRKQWFSSPEIMIQATGNGGATVALAGKRNPYGKLGVIEKGALADVLIYSKNPLEDVAIVEDYQNNLKVIIKDGQFYKNTL